MIEKFVHQHKTEVEFEEYSTNEYKEPYVSYTIESDLVRYNLIKNKSFTLNIISEGSIILKSSSNSFVKQIEYSLDNITWHTVTPTMSGVSISVQSGDKVYLKSNGVSNGTDYISINNSSECTYKISGNILSLIVGDSYLDSDEISSSLSAYTFKNLFLNSTGLTSIDNDNIIFPQTLTIGMYEGTFKGCTSLTNTFELIDNIIPDYAYKETFSGCSSLSIVNPTRLNINDIGAHSCEEMFKDCSNLSNINIILNDCASFCCKGMFKNCSSITTTKLSELNSTSVYESSYEEMYYGCTSLISSYEELYPLELATNCYKGMFAYTKIKKSPDLYAQNLVTGCYEEMFKGCSNLNSVNAKFLTEFNSIYTKDWLIGVAERGTFYRNEHYEYDVITNTLEINYGIPITWEIEMYSKEELAKMYLTFEIQSAGDIQFYRNSYGGSNRTIYYSINNGSWLSLSTPTAGAGSSFHVEVGDSVRFKSTNTSFTNRTDYYSGLRALNGLQFRALGNIASLFLGDNFISNYNTSSFDATGVFASNTGLTSVKLLYLPNNKTYYSLFNGCTALKDFPIIEDIKNVPNSGFNHTFYNCTAIDIEIPNFSNFTSIGNSAFSYMFYGCTNILIPEDFSFPFNSIPDYCCQYMFYNCKKVKLPNNFTISAISIGQYGFYNMFYGCTALDLPENFVLSPEELGANCYSRMFYGCTNLKNAPILPAQILSSYCYYAMFYNCTNLINPPVLSARQAASYCYSQMFYGCTKLVLSESFILPTTDLSGCNYCYQEMFRGCTSITSINANMLPAQQLASYCYQYMFYGCTKLINPPVLSAPQVASYCYYGMFYGCTKLELPQSFILPAIDLSDSNDCYSYMFYGCTSINILPLNILPATTLASACYQSMFYGCTNLTIPSNFILPATNLTGCTTCYGSMFFGCTSIVSVSLNLLPATELESNCYSSMFANCSNLEQAPELLYTGALPSSAYASLFSNCTKINYVKSLASDISSTNCINNWLNNVAPTGTLIHHAQAVYQRNSASGIPTGWNETLVGIGSSRDVIYFENINNSYPLIVYSSSPWHITDSSSNLHFSSTSGLGGETHITITTDNINIKESTFILINNDNASKQITAISFDCSNYETEPLRLNILTDGSFRINWYGYSVGSMTQFNLIYKINNEDWIETNITSGGSITINVNKKDIVYLKGNNTHVHSTYGNNNYGFYFSNFTCNFTVSGNIKSLFTTNLNDTITLNNYDFYSLFNGNKYIISAKYLYLPFQTVSTYMYYQMFYNCSNLENGPIFENNLILSNYSCYSMFYGCSRLARINDLNISQLAQYSCYQMFYHCSELVNFGNLYLTSNGNIDISRCCQSMFAGCTSITTLPSTFRLPSTVLNQYCYQAMFSGCSSLTSLPSGFTLPATDLSGATNCYQSMFSGCSSLTSLPSGFTLPAPSLTSSCYYSMFSSCSSLTSLPSGFTLPATSLTDSCYYSMFSDCSSLTSLSSGFTLPATSLPEKCYYAMFKNCTSLTSLPSNFRILGTSLSSASYAQQCYSMFMNCTSLTSLPSGFTLPALNLSGANQCYSGMFNGCTALTTIPLGLLPATTLANQCYSGMFNGCTSLILPEGFTLPALVGMQSSYESMFAGCTSLTKAPIIEMTSRGNSTYMYTFNYMFSGCTNLNYIKCLLQNPDSNGSYSSLRDWVKNVAPSGLFIKNSVMNSDWGVNSINGIPPGWTVFNDGEPIKITGKNNILIDNSGGTHNLTITSYVNYTITTSDTWLHLSTSSNLSGTYNTPLTITIDANSVNGDRTGTVTISDGSNTVTITIVQHDIKDEELTFEITGSSGYIWWVTNNSNFTKTIEYSKNGGTWASITSSTNTSSYSSSYTNWISASNGDIIKFRGDNTTYGNSNANYYVYFKSSVNFKAYGNLMSLIQSTNFSSVTTLTDTYTFRKLFLNCTQLKDISQLRISAETISDYCYLELFKGCTGITSIPNNLLSTTALKVCCYGDMFNGCTSLTTFPKEMITNFTTLANQCYGGMFNGCTSLILPVGFTLPAPVLTSLCYQYMFANTAITEIPSNLFSTVTTLAATCYKAMFSRTKITSIPSNLLNIGGTLPATCYAEMFAQCKDLESIPATLLPASVLNTDCYLQMFEGCSKLTAIPSTLFSSITNCNKNTCFKYMFKDCTEIESLDENLLPSSTLGNGSCQGMFRGCTSLTTLPSNFLKQTGTAPQNVFREMFYGCTNIEEIPSNFIKYTALNNNCYQQMFYGCTNLNTVPDNLLSVTTMKNNCYNEMFRYCTSLTKTINFCATTLANYCYSFMYADCTSLTTLQGTMVTTSINTFDHCFYGTFYGCSSLVNLPSGFNLTPNSVTTYCYDSMFYGCSSLVNGPLLTTSTTANYCFQNMFNGCINLTLPSGFNLGATELFQYCYCGMFKKCEHLTLPSSFIIDNLTSVAVHACREMFSNCKSITSISNFNLTCATLTQYCYNGMFEACTSLQSLPSNLLQCGANSGDTLGNGCYETMFNECSSLTSIPNNFLPAETLTTECYYGMFMGCSSLESTPVNLLHATNLASSCYRYMFKGCISLFTIPENFLPTGKNGVGALANYCYAGMFENCINLSILPNDLLPATTLANYCYSDMFKNCSNLINSPDLLAESMPTQCYYQMFYNCINLRYIKCLGTNPYTSSNTYNWVYNVNKEGIFVKKSTATWSTGANYIPENFTVINDTDTYTLPIYTTYIVSKNQVNIHKNGTTSPIIIYIVSKNQLTFSHNNIFTINISNTTENTLYIYTISISAGVNNNEDRINDTISIKYNNNIIDTISIIQVGQASGYTIDLNNGEWLVDETVNGYSSNTTLDNGISKMYITIYGYNYFELLVKTYGESNFDYVTISELDATPSRGSTIGGTSGNKWSGYGKSSESTWYTVPFEDIDGGQHIITIMYSKDSSAVAGTDKGYLRIPNQ